MSPTNIYHMNCMVDVVMWPKFDNSSISMREVVITSIFWGFGQKKHFFEGWSWFKFNYLGLALGMTLKLYTCVAKTLKLKVRTFWWLISTSVDITGEKIVCVCVCVCGGRGEGGGGQLFAPSPSWIGLI